MSEENEKKEKKPTPSQPGMNNNQKQKVPWSEKRCLKAARRFSTQAEWERGAPASYKAAHSHNWVEVCSKHMSEGTVTPMPKKSRPKKAAKKAS
ncbi:MAG: hypothetical protein CMP10_03975 [Zetaproteobacteria bacterium]|nr:hypothetical protein [Pseudobdellovibrionaceae bacterium]|tara:strand:+ start:555 stop:836 length:282 start_codon:yes stop_codon:yes gene_type:complete